MIAALYYTAINFNPSSLDSIGIIIFTTGAFYLTAYSFGLKESTDQYKFFFGIVALPIGFIVSLLLIRDPFHTLWKLFILIQLVASFAFAFFDDYNRKKVYAILILSFLTIAELNNYLGNYKDYYFILMIVSWVTFVAESTIGSFLYILHQNSRINRDY